MFSLFVIRRRKCLRAFAHILFSFVRRRDWFVYISLHWGFLNLLLVVKLERLRMISLNHACCVQSFHCTTCSMFDEIYYNFLYIIRQYYLLEDVFVGYAPISLLQICTIGEPLSSRILVEPYILLLLTEWWELVTLILRPTLIGLVLSNGRFSIKRLAAETLPDWYLIQSGLKSHHTYEYGESFSFLRVWECTTG
jgi:hypothetical protein